MGKPYSDDRWHGNPEFIPSLCGNCKHWKVFYASHFPVQKSTMKITANTEKPPVANDRWYFYTHFTIAPPQQEGDHMAEDGCGKLILPGRIR